jgi:hypothetical protein
MIANMSTLLENREKRNEKILQNLANKSLKVNCIIISYIFI